VASRIDQNTTSNSHFDLQFRESESESENETERAPLRVLRSLVSVCLVCLAAVVVARRVPPPVSARSGRSFFSLWGWLPLSRASLGRCWAPVPFRSACG